jgi:hypothetical protein
MSIQMMHHVLFSVRLHRTSHPLAFTSRKFFGGAPPEESWRRKMLKNNCMAINMQFWRPNGNPEVNVFLFGTREIYTERWLDQRGTVFCRHFLEHLESARDALDGFD